ncbi:MAG TPA: hypothetical protein VK116_17025, partial [Planctomycetota bacterium]|nr:hypothetical protein [Planctomycetota bacterium]
MRRWQRFVLIASLAAAAGAAYWAWEKRVELFLVPRAWREVVSRWEELRALEERVAASSSADASEPISLAQA